MMDVHAADPLKRQIVVRTPEHLELTYELAGAGTRAAAYLIDIMLLYLAMSLLQNLVAVVLMAVTEQWMIYAAAISGLFVFSLITAYFIAFELIWSGQTPGKRAVGIRVVKSGGYALRFGDSLIRNLMRAIDFLPLLYGVGLTSLLLSRYSQRLGDLVAGTLVVYERPIDALTETPPPVFAALILPTVVQVGAVPTDVLEVGDEFLRSMDELTPKHRQEIAESLVSLISRTSGLAPAPTQSSEAFLAGLIHQAAQTAPAT